ncbi:hypothetical protein KCP70_00630 [Salmonella enterica subsp. enterica]|nr:hypothetical protein KCP70_00630 [Salmonella enterica subsp. enterica]
MRTCSDKVNFYFCKRENTLKFRKTILTIRVAAAMPALKCRLCYIKQGHSHRWRKHNGIIADGRRHLATLERDVF